MWWVTALNGEGQRWLNGHEDWFNGVQILRGQYRGHYAIDGLVQLGDPQAVSEAVWSLNTNTQLEIRQG